MKLNFKLNIFFLIIPLFLLFNSCVSTAGITKEKITSPEVFSTDMLVPQELTWEKVRPGVEMTGFEIPSLKVTWHCVKIDLYTPGIQILNEPQQKNLGKLFSVKKYAQDTKAEIAFNSTPFDLRGKTYLPVGITKSRETIISKANERYCTLCFSKTEDGFLRAYIMNSQSEDEIEEFDYAFGGFFTILDDDEFISFAKNKRSRVGAGISDDGRMLYVMVATPKFSISDRNGLNYEECARIFKKLGCDTAMQFDGGHSSSLVILGKDVEKPFMQRKVPTILAFKFTE